jgi:hypothetical protein
MYSEKNKHAIIVGRMDVKIIKLTFKLAFYMRSK